MAVLLDTATLLASERAEAIDAAMRYATVPNQITHEDPTGDVRARIDLWEFGVASLLCQRGSGMRLTRTPAQLRLAAPERVSVSLLSRGRWDYTQHGHDQSFDSPRPELVLTDLTSALDYIRKGEGGSNSFMVDFDQLSLSPEAIRRAAPHIRSSPLYDLVRTHIEGLDHVAGSLSGPARSMIGTATTELVRALITSVGQDEVLHKEAMADSLSTRITLYLQRHLTDLDLTPARIARDHNISVRHLYNTWAEGELSLAQWIMAQRLEAARRELVKPGAQAQTIAAVARHCGFTDATHFSRRFREAYGTSPREWRQLQAPVRAPGEQPTAS
jgi:AraC-like DNA-binding protein